MASIRKRERRDGTSYFMVLYRHHGKQTSTSFEDFAGAHQFQEMVDKFGPANALETVGKAVTAAEALTVEEWLSRYIDRLTGVDANTTAKYRAYARRDINPVLGQVPLAALSADHLARWVKTMMTPDEDGWTPSSKTMANKRGFLSAALTAAIPAYLDTNPCSEIRLPRAETPEMVFLTHAQFDVLLAAITEPWRPLVEFLVVSGARWGEVSALKPADVDRDQDTVRISRTWKQGSGGYRIGPPKTPRSRRTIDVPASVLDKLDYSHDWLFVNRDLGPVRAQGFYKRVWAPAVARSGLDPRPRIHDLRHSCASWAIWAGVPLPVISAHLGHESITTTVNVYGHLDRTASKAMADAMSKARK